MERTLDGVAAYMAGLERGERHIVAEEWVDLDVAELAGDKRLKEAQKASREAEKALRAARKVERQALRDARERIAKATRSA